MEFGNGYCPIVAGVIPKDPYKLGLVAASSFVNTDVVDSDDDDDYNEEKAAIETNIYVTDGMIVVTEFGIGPATIKRKDSPLIYVDIPARNTIKQVPVPLTSVFVPARIENRKRLQQIYNAMQKRKLPTTVITHEGNSHNETMVFHDIYVPESELLKGSLTIHASEPLYKVTGVTKTAEVPLLKEVAVRSVTRVGSGISPRANKPPAPTPPDVVRDTPKSEKEKARTIAVTGKKYKINIPMPGRPVSPPAQPGKVVVRSYGGVRTPQAKLPATPLPAKPKIPSKAKPSMELHIAHLDQQLSVFAWSETGAEILQEHGFHRIGASVSAEIKTWRGLDALIDYLDKNFTVNQEALNDLEANLKIFRSNEHKMDRVVSSIAKQSKMLRYNKRASTDEIHPYLVVIDDAVHLTINASVNKDARKLYNKLVVRGVGRFDKEDPFYVKFCHGFDDMHELLLTLDDHVRITNTSDLAKEYEAEKKHR